MAATRGHRVQPHGPLARRAEGKLSRTTKDLHADERDSPKVQRQRRALPKTVAAIAPHRWVFVEESGAHTAMTRTSGHAPGGPRVHASAPGHGESVTLICGLRLSGVTAPVVFAGASDTAAFPSSVEQVLVPQRHAGDVVTGDNLKPHQARGVVGAVEHVGAHVLPLPPWSPDRSPIEEMFSKVKEALRSVAARTVETVTTAIGSAWHDVSPKDIRGWFRARAAYAMQS
jgi:transposase